VILIVGAASPLRVVVALAHRSHCREPRYHERRYRSLGGSAEDHVRIASANQLVPHTYSVRTAGAGQGRADRRSLDTELKTALRNARIPHDLDHREGAHSLKTLVVHLPPRALLAHHPADPGADNRSYPLRMQPQKLFSSSVVQGHKGRGYSELGEAVHPLRSFALHKVPGLKVRTLGSDLHVEALRVKEGYGAGPTLVGQERAPELLAAYSNGSHKSYPRYVSCLSVVRRFVSCLVN
jgi:hypothetical protein